MLGHTSTRLPGVEGLRAIAAGSILVYHVWLYSAPDGRPVDLGYLSRFALQHLPSGVTLFFALSGFLLYRPLAAALLGGHARPSTKTYFRNRALRIIPAYWVILGITGFVLGAVLVRTGPDQIGTGNFLTAPRQFLMNALLLQNYSGASIDSGIGPAWSLAVELMFYLALPILGWLAFKAATETGDRSRRLVASMAPPILALGIGCVTAVLLEFGTVADSMVGRILARSFFNHADLFALGMALAVLHVLVERREVRLPKLWRPAAVAGLGGVVGLTVLLVDRGIILKYQGAPIYEGLTSIACALLLALVVLPARPNRAAAAVVVLESRALVSAGLASYSLFLWHEPIVRWLNHQGFTASGSSGFWLNLMLAGVVAGLLSAATYFVVEKPALARKSIRLFEADKVTKSSPVLVPSGEVRP